MFVLCASGYDESFVPAGGWSEAAADGRTIVIAGREFLVADLPSILQDRHWALPVINFCRRAERHGCPWGPVGWLEWPEAYQEIKEAIEDAEFALERERK
ncbi:MAG: hypothetical protein LWX23_03205 [Spirochaetia bacterium]|nr:hypothetical protein [Spirochaetia bacterium]